MVRHSRRELLRGSLALVGLGVISGCGRVPYPTQQAAEPRTIGFLQPTTGPYIGTPTAVYEAFRRGLRAIGYVEGKDVVLDYRPGSEPAQYDDLAADLVRRRVDLIVTSSAAALAAKAQTETIPVVFGFSGDPVEAGLVDSYSHPGRNMTGMSFLGERLVAKRLDLLKETAPGIARVAVLATPTHPGAQREWRGAQQAAESLGLALRRLEVSTSDDFDRAFAAMVSEPTDALLVFADGVTLAHRGPIAAFALERRLPSVFGWREYAEAGGLLAYGPNTDDAWARIAVFVDKILKGAKPADLPVEEPTTFELTANLKTARAIGLAVPPSVLQQATELIQ